MVKILQTILIYLAALIAISAMILLTSKALIIIVVVLCGISIQLISRIKM